MKYKYIFFVFFALISTLNILGQVNNSLKKLKYERVIEAYGYLAGQEYSINLITKEFPQFESNIIKAQLAFNLTFGKSKELIKKYLVEYLGQNNYIQYEDNLTLEMQELFSKQTFTEEIVTKFITEVENRANGNIASPVLETLLSFQYADNPQGEFLTGFTNIFKTKGHLKSKNTDWQIKVPKSWKAEEADRPNIIQKFINDFGSGYNSIMLAVKEIPLRNGYKFSEKELADLFSEKEMIERVPIGGKYISSAKMVLDNNIGGMLEIEQIIPRLDMEMKIRMLQFMFIRGNKMYTLHGTVSSEKTESDLALEMKKFLPLYKLVANSIVVNDQYK